MTVEIMFEKRLHRYVESGEINLPCQTGWTLDKGNLSFQPSDNCPCTADLPKNRFDFDVIIISQTVILRVIIVSKLLYYDIKVK